MLDPHGGFLQRARTFFIRKPFHNVKPAVLLTENQCSRLEPWAPTRLRYKTWQVRGRTTMLMLYFIAGQGRRRAGCHMFRPCLSGIASTTLAVNCSKITRSPAWQQVLEWFAISRGVTFNHLLNCVLMLPESAPMGRCLRKLLWGLYMHHID